MSSYLYSCSSLHPLGYITVFQGEGKEQQRYLIIFSIILKKQVIVFIHLQEYLLADRNMSFIPVAFSLMASFMSSITLLGVSAENYMYGTQFVVINLAYIIGTPLAAYFYLPVFYKLQNASVYKVNFILLWGMDKHNAKYPTFITVSGTALWCGHTTCS